VGAPGADAAVMALGDDHIPMAAGGTAATAGGLQGNSFGVQVGKLLGDGLGVKGVAAETALDGLQLDELGAGGAFFLAFEAGIINGRGRRRGGLGIAAADGAAFGVEGKGQEPPAKSKDDRKEGAEAQAALKGGFLGAGGAVGKFHRAILIIIKRIWSFIFWELFH
jgi:hypothetical protein